jgi:hypothetical protein
MFVTPDFFRHRLETLARLGYKVLPLGDAVRMLGEGTLPPKSVVITFDDGFYDFHLFAYPLLRKFGFPATVYQTTYYSDLPYPIYNLVMWYLFWRGRERKFNGAPYGVPQEFDLATDANRMRAAEAFRELARRQRLTIEQKDELAERVAAELGIDYAEIRRLRMLQLMTSAEVQEIAAGGIDVQLHTHRHRTPVDEKLFTREIRDNRQWISDKLAKPAAHFCYPSGVHHPEFLPWLREEKVLSATTCDYGIASRENEPLLLPRLLDSMNVTDQDFEGWLSGIGALLPHRAT